MLEIVDSKFEAPQPSETESSLQKQTQLGVFAQVRQLPHSIHYLTHSGCSYLIFCTLGSVAPLSAMDPLKIRCWKWRHFQLKTCQFFCFLEFTADLTASSHCEQHDCEPGGEVCWKPHHLPTQLWYISDRTIIVNNLLTGSSFRSLSCYISGSGRHKELF